MAGSACSMNFAPKRHNNAFEALSTPNTNEDNTECQWGKEK